MAVPGQVCIVQGKNAELATKHYLNKHSKKYPNRVAYQENKGKGNCWLVVESIDFVPDNFLDSLIKREEAIDYMAKHKL